MKAFGEMLIGVAILAIIGVFVLSIALAGLGELMGTCDPNVRVPTGVNGALVSECVNEGNVLRILAGE